MFLQDPLYVEILEKMVAQLSRDDKDIIDIGCRTGNLIERIAEKMPEARIAGVDPSEGMREVCAQRFNDFERVTIAEGEGLRLPFPDNSFDAALSSLALHHVPFEMKKDCAREIARILRPGGGFIHADPFCSVSGAKEDPERCRDIIEKIITKAIFSLEQGAWRMMLGELSSLVPIINGDGEYLSTVPEWIEDLRSAGFHEFEVMDLAVELPKIIAARLAPAL